MAEIIDELQAKHQEHIEKLKILHESEISHLKSVIETLKQEFTQLKRENEELKGMVGEVEGEVEGLRGNFEMIQSRLGKIIIEEDDLVKLVKLSIGNEDSLHKNNVMSTSLKYLKKIEGSDPINLSKILDIPFNPPDRPISLSNSLLRSISAHLQDDPATGVIFSGREEVKVLLGEIIRVKMELNEISKYFLKNTRKDLKFDLADKSMNIIEWLIEEHKDNNNNNNNNNNNMIDSGNRNVNRMLSSILSAFKK